jgi:hypothetical protein
MMPRRRPGLTVKESRWGALQVPKGVTLPAFGATRRRGFGRAFWDTVRCAPAPYGSPNTERWRATQALGQAQLSERFVEPHWQLGTSADYTVAYTGHGLGHPVR